MTTFAAHYRDGTIVEGLNHEDSERLFEEAFGTHNPCTVYPWPVPDYKAP